MVSQQKVVFIVPRYHTNLIGWVSGLNQLGLACEMWVTSHGRSEDYSILSPKVLRHLLKDTQRLSFVGSKIWPTKFSRLLQNKQPDYIILRFELDFLSLYRLFCVYLSKIPFVVYSQWPIEGLRGPRRIIRYLLTSLFRISIISPVWSRDPKPIPTSRTLDSFKKLNFVPFAIEQNRIAIISESVSQVEKKLKLVAVGKFQDRKNHDKLLGFFLENRLCETFDWDLTIIGEVSDCGHESIFRKLQERIVVSPLGWRVRLEKNLTHSQCLGLMAESDLFILISENEPASISNLEAMALGKAIIVSSDNGTGNYIKNASGGFLIDGVEELEKVFSTILKDKGILLRMGKTNLQDSREHFDPVKIAQNIMRIFQISVANSNQGKTDRM
jgi:glycosyltransferase involved in cell wall biosynthesis